VGAVPGRVTASLAAGPLGLLRAGARVVRDAHDALELVCGDGAAGLAVRPPAAGVGADPSAAGIASDLRAPEAGLEAPLCALLHAVSDGDDTPERLLRAGHSAAQITRGLGELELLGYVRRTLDGSYTVVP
jgi:predicted Rossmann fold nucleotide-binding protein DprA/Smf involved in DNA uptake